MGSSALGLGLGLMSAVIAGSAGCGLATFACTQDEQCAGVGPAPRCEASGYCSYEDTECEGGRRFGDAAPGGIAQRCVPAEPDGSSGGDVGTSSTGTDPTISAASTSSGSSEPQGSSESASSSGTQDATTTTSTEPSCVDWWDCSWRSRVRLTIQAPTAEDLLQVPVPVQLSGLPELDEALRFVSLSGEVLAHEIDQGLAWVSIPQLPGSSELEFFAYWGNPSAGAAPNPEAVWSAPFALVVHGDDFEDASGHHEPNETDVAGHAPAVFGDGILFDGVDDAVVFGPDEASADLRADGLTFTAWVRLDPDQSPDFPRIIDHTEVADSLSGWTLAVSPPGPEGTYQLRIDLGLEAGESRVTFDESLPAGWFFLALTVSSNDETQARFNEVVTALLPAQSSGVAVSDAKNFLSLGRSSHSPERWLAGELDEVRLARGVRSDAWLETAYQLAVGEFVTASEPEVAPSASR